MAFFFHLKYAASAYIFSLIVILATISENQTTNGKSLSIGHMQTKSFRKIWFKGQFTSFIDKSSVQSFSARPNFLNIIMVMVIT